MTQEKVSQGFVLDLLFSNLAIDGLSDLNLKEMLIIFKQMTSLFFYRFNIKQQLSNAIEVNIKSIQNYLKNFDLSFNNNKSNIIDF